jgi:hypothetical protein
MGRGQGGHLFGAAARRGAAGTGAAQQRSASQQVPQVGVPEELFDDARSGQDRLIVESRSSLGAREPWEQGQTIPDVYGRRHHFLWTGADRAILFNGDLIGPPDKEIVIATYAALVAAGRYSPEVAREHLRRHVEIHGANTARREAILGREQRTA